MEKKKWRNQLESCVSGYGMLMGSPVGHAGDWAGGGSMVLEELS